MPQMALIDELVLIRWNEKKRTSFLFRYANYQRFPFDWLEASKKTLFKAVKFKNMKIMFEEMFNNKLIE